MTSKSRGSDPVGDLQGRGLALEQIRRKSVEYRRRLQAYSRAKRGAQATPDDILAILRRLNAIWEVGDIPDSVTLPRSTVSFGGYPGLEEISALLRHPIIYRLNSIKQLSTTYLWTHLDATHTRLAHSLGTVAWAWKFLEQFQRDGIQIDPEDYKAVLIGALIHDCEQGPLGHSLDIMRDLFVEHARYTRLDKHFLRLALNDREDPLRIAIVSFLPKGERELVMDSLKCVLDKDVCRTQHREKYFLSQVLDYYIDADRIDYMIGDSHHMGEPSPNVSEIIRLINRAQVRVAQDTGNKNERAPFTRIIFSSEDIDPINRFLAQRRHLYRNFYESRPKLIVDEMVAHAICFLLESHHIDPYGPGDPAMRAQSQRIVKEICRLVDGGLMQLMYELGDAEPGPALHAMDLLRTIESNNPFVEVHCMDLTREDVKQAEERIRALRGQQNKVLERKLIDTHGGREPSEDETLSPDQIWTVFTELTKDWDPKWTLLYFDFLYCGGFRNKLKLERSLWKDLLDDPEFKAIFKASYLAARYEPKEIDDNLLTAYEQLPLVHISVPSYVRPVARDIVEHAKEPTYGERIAYYNNVNGDNVNGDVFFLDPDLATEIGYQTWSVIVSTSRAIASNPRAKALIIDAFNNAMLISKKWLHPGLSGHGMPR